MKKLIVASTQNVDEYCDTVGELISVLRKFPKDTPIYYVEGRRIKKASARVHKESATDSLGYSTDKLCIDVTDF